MLSVGPETLHVVEKGMIKIFEDSIYFVVHLRKLKFADRIAIVPTLLKRGGEESLYSKEVFCTDSDQRSPIKERKN